MTRDTLTSDQAKPRVAGAAAPGHRASRSPRRGLTRAWRHCPPSAWLALIILLALCGAPLLALLRICFLQDDGHYGWGNFIAAYANARLIHAMLNTLVLGLAVCVIATALAIPLAWAVSRTDIKGKGFINLCALAVFICPPYLNTVAWMFLAGPNTGLLNRLWSTLTGDTTPLLNVYTFTGMAFVMGTSLFCFIFTFVRTALDTVSSDVEEAAAMVGASRWRTTLGITLPLATPAILASTALVFLQAIALYGVPALLAYPARYPVLVTTLLEFFQDIPARTGVATAYSMPLVLFTLASLWMQKRIMHRRSYVTLTGKSGARALVRLGRWRTATTLTAWALCFVCVVMPILALIVVSFSRSLGDGMTASNFTIENFVQLTRYPGMRDAIVHTLVYSAAAAVLAVALSVYVGYLAVRRKVAIGPLLSGLAMAPYVLPAIVLSIGFYITLSAPPVSLYGTGLLLILVFAVRFLPISYAGIATSFSTFNVEMEEAARILGASSGHVLRHIVLPMIRRSVLANLFLVFILSCGELSAAVFLSNENNQVASIAMLNFSDNGQMEYIAAMGVAMIVIITLIIGIGSRIAGKDFLNQGRSS